MSGGSYDYAYRHAEEMADCLLNKSQSALRRAFAKHLHLVAKAMHDIEWVDSCDYGTSDDLKAINAVLGTKATVESETLKVLREDAKELIKQLEALVK